MTHEDKLALVRQAQATLAEATEALSDANRAHRQARAARDSALALYVLICALNPTER